MKNNKFVLLIKEIESNCLKGIPHREENLLEISTKLLTNSKIKKIKLKLEKEIPVYLCLEKRKNRYSLLNPFESKKLLDRTIHFDRWFNLKKNKLKESERSKIDLAKILSFEDLDEYLLDNPSIEEFFSSEEEKDKETKKIELRLKIISYANFSLNKIKELLSEIFKENTLIKYDGDCTYSFLVNKEDNSKIKERIIFQTKDWLRTQIQFI